MKHDPNWAFELEAQFLEQHRNADSIVVDEESGHVLKAEYHNPALRIHNNNMAFWHSVRQVMAADDDESVDPTAPKE